LVLLAVASANYEFIYCDTRTNGCILDDVTENKKLYQKLGRGDLQLPKPKIKYVDILV
jgi:hypothetical protein